MKIAVLSYSGNVGKTTLARHLLQPRISGSKLVSIESINADESQGDALRGKDFAQLQEFLLSTDSAVVDIGASNVEDLLVLMKKYRGSHEDFDYFVIPCVPAQKQQSDTVATLVDLLKMGVPHDKVRVVFNQIEDGADLAQTFQAVLRFAAQNGFNRISPKCSVASNEIFQRLKGSDRSIAELATDATDYKALIAKESDSAKKSELASQLATKRLAVGIVPELQACFEALGLK